MKELEANQAKLHQYALFCHLTREPLLVFPKLRVMFLGYFDPVNGTVDRDTMLFVVASLMFRLKHNHYCTGEQFTPGVSFSTMKKNLSGII